MRVSMLLRWSLRDLRERWVAVLAIAAVLSIGVGLFTGLGSMKQWRIQSTNASTSRLDLHTVRLSLPPDLFVRRGDLVDAVGSADLDKRLTHATERLVLPIQARILGRGRTTPVPGRIIGSSRPDPQIDRLEIVRGESARRGGGDWVALEREFARMNGIRLSDRLELTGGSRVSLSAQVRSPEYFFVTGSGESGILGAGPQRFATVFSGLRLAGRVTDQRGRVNELVIRRIQGIPAAHLAGRAERAIERRTGMDVTATLGRDEPGVRLLLDDARNDQKYMNVFAALLLLGAAIGAFNLISRIVESQRRQIGISMALGVPRRWMAVRPLLLGLEVGALGIAGGLAVGSWLQGAMGDLIATAAPMPVLKTGFDPQVFAEGAAIALLLPLVAAAFPVWRALRVPPVEAIRAGFRSAPGAGGARLARRLRLPGGSLAQMPLRNLLRARRRTILTTFGIAAVLGVFVTLFGSMDSFLSAIDELEAQAKGDSPARIEVVLDRPTALGSGPAAKLDRDSRVEQVVESLRMPIELSANGESFDALLELLPVRNGLWHPAWSEGRLRPRHTAIAIAEEAAHDLDVERGDDVKLRYLPPSGQAALLGEQKRRLRVGALHSSPVRVSAYGDRRLGYALDVAGVANVLEVALRKPSRSLRFQRQAGRLEGVRSVTVIRDATNGLEDRLAEILGVLVIAGTSALVLVLLISFNSASIAADERRRDTATMLTYGVRVPRLVLLSVAESTITGLLGTLLGLVLGGALLSWLFGPLTESTMPDLGASIVLSPNTLLLTGLVGVVAAGLAPVLLSRRLARTDIPATLRVVE